MAEFSVSSTSITSLVAVVRLSGTMTADNFAVMEEEFGKILAGGTRGVILELSALEGATSAGLGAILDLSRALREKGGKAIAAAGGGSFAGLADLLGLRDKLSLAETLEQAKKEMADLKPPSQ